MQNMRKRVRDEEISITEENDKTCNGSIREEIGKCEANCEESGEEMKE